MVAQRNLPQQANTAQSEIKKTVNDLGQRAADTLSETFDREDFQALLEDLGSSCSKYLKSRPIVAVAAVFAIGFYTGWKIKPW